MTLDLVDTVWSAMRESEFYTPNDLSNTLGEPTEAIVRILEFLARYGFAQKVTKRELIFRKVVNVPNPCDTLRILRTVVEDDHVETSRVATVSKLPGRSGQP